MTDIELDQIREGQTVRAHCRGAYLIEGTVIATGRYLVFGNAAGSREIHDSLITRVELLSEPAPQWEVGQLAEITWRFIGCEPDDTQRAIAFRAPAGAWHLTDGYGVIADSILVGEPRLLKAVPAGAVVLPAEFGQQHPEDIRRNARYASTCRGRIHDGAALTLLALADAIEEAQR